MTVDDKIKYEQLQYDKKKKKKKSALSSGKIDKYEYLTYLKGEEILSSDQSKIIE